MREELGQMALFELIALCGAKDAVILHVPNGARCSPIEGARLKRLGLLPGVPDILAAFAPGNCTHLELKAGPHGRVSDDQVAVMRRLQDAGAEVAVAWSLQEAIEKLTEWQLLRRGVTP